MRKIVSARGRAEIERDPDPDPNPLWLFAVGWVYVFRTAPGHRLVSQLEAAVRRYAADPAALWRLMLGEDDDVIDAPGDPSSLPSGG